MRAARTSTVHALADSARPPRRTGWLIAISARLPVPLLLALRVAARRPRRVVLGVVSIAITVSGIFVALVAQRLPQRPNGLAGGWTRSGRTLLRQVLLVVMVIAGRPGGGQRHLHHLGDGARQPALLGAGARPRRDPARGERGSRAAQVLPALAGAVLGVFPEASPCSPPSTRSPAATATGQLPPLWQLLAVVAGTILVVAALTAVPARLGGRRPVTETLQAELA